jgi:PAS domain S-box-containing protein
VSSWFLLLLLLPIAFIAIALVRAEKRDARAESASEHDVLRNPITDAMADAVIHITPDGTIVSANPASARIFALSHAADVIGLHITELCPARQRNEFRALVDLLARRPAGFHDPGLDTRGLRRNGDEFPANIAFNDVTVQGRRYFTGVVRDVTGRRLDQLRRSEAQLRRVLEGAPACIFHADAECRLNFYNRRFAESFGLPPGVTLRPTLAQVLGEDVFERMRADIDSVLAGKSAQHDRAYGTAAGVPRHFAVHFHPQRDEEGLGPVTGFFAVLSDITEIKRSATKDLAEAAQENCTRRIGLLDGESETTRLHQ